ncbi:uncharacterized protein SAMN05428988_6001 [Chitinophaga sp. YR573]|uniref:TPM domain-containing protein n=1 Tax=Chitinophaga sp. YR573 TaxID=1881040 RepID=UPI0008BB67EC|nr:TPM domain-containing protein [Chitinophaga sp. YR573]SEW45324.1 uncharacterized protein SAMN05428988_6001 [Chitinophaga sp. YR573]
MRVIVVCFLISFLALSCGDKKNGFSVDKIPDPMLHGGYVSNPDHIVSTSAEASLNALMSDLSAKGTAQVAVVLLKTIGDKVPKDIAHEIFRTWKPGQKEKNNGLVVLLVEDQHRIEFETGYGLEGDLPDVICFRIQQQKMLPFFKKNDYDEGMWQGMNAVADVLNHADSATVTANEPESPADETPENFEAVPDAPSRELPGDGIIFLYVFYVIISRICAGFFISKKDKRPFNDPPILYNPGIFSGLWIYVFPALEIVAVFLFTNYSFHWWSVPLIMYLNWLTYLLYRTILVHINANRLLNDNNRVQRYTGFSLAHKDLGIAAIVFPIPFFFYYKWHKARLDRLRSTVYSCDQCKNPMELLGNKNKKNYMSKGQLMEEKQGSVIYDVWSCKTCDTRKVLGYDSIYSNIAKCPKCSNKTLQATKKETVKRPTSRTKGQGLQYYECKFCGYTEKEAFVIGMLSSSDSSSGSSGSSSDSSSSSSSDSWGGGDSGGGGSGSSW